MKQLRETLTVIDARAISLMRVPTKDGTTWVWLAKGTLTPEMADILRCRNQVFNLNDRPYPALKVHGMDHQISNCELAVLNLNLFPSIVTGFSVKPSEAADADGALEVHFRMKFTSGGKEMNEFLDMVENNPFELALLAIQGSLFDMPATKGDGPEGGTKVNMSPGDEGDDEQEEEPPPLVQAMMDGEAGLVDEAIRTGNSVASAREMAGGTTEAAKRRRKTLHEVRVSEEPVAAEDEPDIANQA